LATEFFFCRTAILFIFPAATFALVIFLRLAGALGLDTILALGTLFGLGRLLRFAVLFDLVRPLNFVLGFDSEANFLLTFGAAFRAVLVIFLVTEACFFLDLSFLAFLDSMAPSSDKNVRKLADVRIRPDIKAAISKGQRKRK